MTATHWPHDPPELVPVGRQRWVLIRPHRAHRHEIPEGFETDLGSFPFFLQWLPWFRPSGAFDAEFLLHDWLYSLGDMSGITRREADAILFRDLFIVEIHPVRLALIKAGVRSRGWLRWGDRHPTNINRRKRPPHRI